MDREDFDRLYREHAQPVFGFLAYRTGDRVLAEDLAADVFERAFKARRRFDPARGTEAAWLYTIALNRLRDHARRSGTEGRALEASTDPPPSPSSPEAAAEDRDMLGRAMVVLSAEQREVVALRFGADLSVPQIAKLLRTRGTTVEGRLYRALRKLRAALETPTGPPAAAGGSSSHRPTSPGRSSAGRDPR